MSLDRAPWSEGWSSRHPTRADLDDSQAYNCIVLAKRFTRVELDDLGGSTEEAVLKWGGQHGLVPANRLEACGFAMDPDTCDLVHQGRLIALGDVFTRGKGCPEEVLAFTSGGSTVDANSVPRNELRIPTDYFLFTRV